MKDLDELLAEIKALEDDYEAKLEAFLKDAEAS